MLDINALERRWLRYKIKRYLPIFLIIILISLTLIGLYLFMHHTNHTKIKTTPKPLQQLSKKNQNDSATMVLEPSMQFIQSLPFETKMTETIEERPVIKKVVKSANQSHITSPINKPQIQPVTPPPAPLIQDKSTNIVGIKRDSNAFNIAEIETRFKLNSNPHLGLYIARYHYDHGNYDEAYNYALKTNAINNSMEESWLIFSKSLIKMGRTEQAKKTLQMYINQTNSENAKNLLDSLSNETSK